MVRLMIGASVAVYLVALLLAAHIHAHPEPPLCYEVGSVFLDREEFTGVWWLARPPGADKLGVYITLPQGRR